MAKQLVVIAEGLTYISLFLLPMRLYVAVTDKDWFALHASKPEVEEVNFWRPSPDATFKALQPGELLLFKLHSPDNFIVGGGFFTRFLQLPGRSRQGALGRSVGTTNAQSCGSSGAGNGYNCSD
jgi:hypothetical protein